MRHARRNPRRAASLLVLAVTLVTPASAQSIDREQAARRQVEEAEKVRSVELDVQREAAEQAARALEEEKQLTDAQAAAYAKVKAADAEVARMTRHLADLEQSKQEASRRIAARAAILRPMLPLMVRLSTFPVETLLASGLPAEESVRGIIILRALAGKAEVETRSLAEDQKALDAASREAEAMLPKLTEARKTRMLEADALVRQVGEATERRRAAEQEAAGAARHAAAEAARAKNLRSMLQILVMQRRLDEAQAREDGLRAEREQQMAAAEAARLRQAALAQPAGAGALAANAKPAAQLLPPVTGTLVRGWGDPEDGEPATGMSWQTELGAAVAAPCGGTVAFAEPFRGYGLLVIIDCGGGYHAVLSGLDQLSVAPGKAILAGSAVGRMAPSGRMAAASSVPMASGVATPSSVPPGAEAAAMAPPVLYFELRKGGRPVNPAPWLRPF